MKKWYTLRDVYNVADGELREMMRVVLPEDAIPEWFYSPNLMLNNETPFDLCFTGRDSELRNRLIKLGIEVLVRTYMK